MTPAKALIVESERNQRVAVCQLLSAWGLRVEAAQDGVEAVTKFIAWAPQVVITELKLSKMDGFELLERISVESQASTVVVLTAQGSIDQAVKAVRLGAFDFLEKPLNPTRLRTVVE